MVPSRRCTRAWGAIHALEEFQKKEQLEKETLEKEEREKWDSYQTVEARKLEAHKLDYIGKKIKVDFKNVGDVDIQTSQGQLRFRVDGAGIDVLVEESSSLYDWVIENEPALGQLFTVWGTVKSYRNTYDTVYITPDQLQFHACRVDPTYNLCDR
ncbi:MAG: hypothetical protein ACREXS_17930 [Gammaproteobacteria bacterium]